MRAGTGLNWLQATTDLVFLVVFWRLRYKLSLRDLAEMLVIRGLDISQGRTLAYRRPAQASVGNVGRSWYGDETYAKVGGDGSICSGRSTGTAASLTFLHETRNQAAAEAFFRSDRGSRNPSRA